MHLFRNYYVLFMVILAAVIWESFAQHVNMDTGIFSSGDTRELIGISPSKVETALNELDEEEGEDGQMTESDFDEPVIRVNATTTVFDSSTETLGSSSNHNISMSHANLSTKSTLTVTATRIGMARYVHTRALQDHNEQLYKDEGNDARPNYIYPQLINRTGLSGFQIPSPSPKPPIIILDSSETTTSFLPPRATGKDVTKDGGSNEAQFYDYELNSQPTFPYHHPFIQSVHDSTFENADHQVDNDVESREAQSFLRNNGSDKLTNLEDSTRLQQSQSDSLSSYRQLTAHQNNLPRLDLTLGNISLDASGSNQHNLYEFNWQDFEKTQGLAKPKFFDPTMDDFSPPTTEALYLSLEDNKNVNEDDDESQLDSSSSSSLYNEFNDTEENLPNPVALVSSDLHESIPRNSDNDYKNSNDSLQDQFAEAFRKVRPSASSRRIKVGRGEKRVRMKVRKINRANFSSSFGDSTIFPPSPTQPFNGIGNDLDYSTKAPRKRMRSTTTTTSTPAFTNSFNMHSSDHVPSTITRTKLMPVDIGKAIQPLLPIPSTTSSSSMNNGTNPVGIGNNRKIPSMTSRSDMLFSSASPSVIPTEFIDSINALTVAQQIESPSKSSYTEKSNFVATTKSPFLVDIDKTRQGQQPQQNKKSPKEWLQTSHSTEVHHHHHLQDHPDENPASKQDRKNWENNYMNLQQNSFYSSASAEEVGQSVVDINSGQHASHAHEKEEPVKSIPHHDENDKMDTFPHSEDYGTELIVGEKPSEYNQSYHQFDSSRVNGLGDSSSDANQFSVHPHLNVLTPDHPQTQEYFKQLQRGGYASSQSADNPSSGYNPEQQSSHFDRSKFQQHGEMHSSEFDVDRVVDDENILKYTNNQQKQQVVDYEKELKPIVIHHHHHEVVHPPSSSSNSIEQQHPIIVDSNNLGNNFQGNLLGLFDHNNLQDKTNPFSSSNNFNNLPALSKNMIHQFQTSSRNHILGPTVVEKGGFQPLPPFTQFPSQPSSQSSYSSYYRPFKPNRSNFGSSAKRGPISKPSSEGFDGVSAASPSITLPMPGLVNVPIPPSDAFALREVTPNRHFPPHSHSMSQHADYEPANPPLPNGHQLQYHFDPFIQNAGEFPHEDNHNNNNSPASSHGNHLDKFVDFSQVSQGAQGNNYPGNDHDDEGPSFSRRPSSNKFPSRFKDTKNKQNTASSYFNNGIDQQSQNGRGRPRPSSGNNKYHNKRPSNINFHDDGFLDDDKEKQQQYGGRPQFEQSDTQEDGGDGYENHIDNEIQYNSRPSKSKHQYGDFGHYNEEDDPYQAFDGNPPKESNAGDGGKAKEEGSPYSDKPYVLMFPSLVPEEAMVPVRPKIQGREVPVISAAEHSPATSIPTQNLGPGMEVVPVHPREQMMNVLAAKYHDNMMSQYMENKRKPPLNIYTPYGVLVPMGEIGGSPSSSANSNKYLTQESASSNIAKGIGVGLNKYTSLGEFDAQKNIYLSETQHTIPESGIGGIQSTIQPAIDILADKLALKLSALGYILKHPPKHLSFHLSSSEEQQHLNQYSGSSGNKPVRSNQYPSKMAALPSSLSTKTTVLNNSITSKGVPKTEFRKYVKELLKEKLQVMLDEIDETERREKSQYSAFKKMPLNPKPPSPGSKQQQGKQLQLQAQYSNHLPVAVPSPQRMQPLPSPPHQQQFENPNSNGGGILQSIRKFFSFGSNTNSYSKDGSSNNTKPPQFNHPFRSKPWFGGGSNSRNDNVKLLPARRKHRLFKPNNYFKGRNGNPNQNNVANNANNDGPMNPNGKSKNKLNEVQKLVHLLLESGVGEDGEEDKELISVDALLRGLGDQNSRSTTNQTNSRSGGMMMERRRPEEVISYNAKSNENKFRPSAEDLVAASSNNVIAKSKATSSIRVVKPFKKQSVPFKKRQMPKNVSFPIKWKPVPE